MSITNNILEDISDLYSDLYEGRFVPGKTKLRPASERNTNVETPAQRRRREAEKNRRQELESRADNILAGLQSGSRKKPSDDSKDKSDNTPKATVRRLPKGVKRDTTAAEADKILRQLRSEEVLSERKKRMPKKRWWDDDGDGNGWEPNEVRGSFRKKKKKVTKEDFSNWRSELFEVANDEEENGYKINDKKKVKNKIKTSALGGGIKLGEEIEENLGGTLIEMIEVDELDFIVETVYEDLIFEGYDEEEVEYALQYALVEAKVTYGHDTEEPYEKNTSTRRKVSALGRLARMALKSKGKELRKKASQAQVDVYNKGRERYQSAVDTARRTKKNIQDAPRRAKKSTKSKIKNLAQRVVDRMTEDYDLNEMSVSISQQQAAGAAYAAKKGETSPSELKGASLEMYKTMSEKELRDYAKTKHEGLPRKKKVEEENLTLSQKEVMLHKQRASIDSRLAQEKRKKLQQNRNNVSGIEEAKLPKSQKQGKKVRQSKTLKLTDCDDCTHDQSHPDAAKIDLKDKKSGKTISRLTPGQFAHHKPSDNQTYGFDDFRSTKKVKDTTKPNKKIVTALNNSYEHNAELLDERIRRYPQQRAITARGSMDDNRGFADDMKKRIGVKNLKSVSFTGNMPRTDRSGNKLGGPEKKAVVAKHIAKKNPDAKKIDFYDDHKGNVEAVSDTLAKSGKKGRKRVSGPKVRGFVAKPDDKGEVRPVRLGGEGSSSGRRGIRSSTSPASSQKESQKRRKKSM